MKKQIATLGILGLIACGAQAEPLTMQGEGPVLVADHHMEAANPGTVVNVAANAGDFNTLVAAIQAANLQEALKGDGPFTILAPTDEAFAALPKSTLDALLANPDKLATILKYHVVSGNAPASQVVTMTSLDSLQGSTIEVKAEDGKVMLNDAKVLKTDVMADNGVIHVIDKVLIPADFDLATLEN
ncbi:MAG: fasciclin domain-containing protein [Candidatus Eremiobacteraeota bacterium]|nr:fasciclin domain-containing protein [Candidatus Eremiobacteraeota bacterium]